MKTTPEKLAELKAVAAHWLPDCEPGTDMRLLCEAIPNLIADLEETQQNLATADECWVFFQDLCNAHGCDGIIAMAAELTATRKQLEEAQAKLAAAEKDAGRYRLLADALTSDDPGCVLGPAFRNHTNAAPTREQFDQCIDAAIAAQEKNHE